jgi:hypothetical protein
MKGSVEEPSRRAVEGGRIAVLVYVDLVPTKRRADYWMLVELFFFLEWVDC